MALINQISEANTFGEWLSASQGLIEHANYFSNTANIVFETANNTVNVYSNTVNTYNLTVAVNANAWIARSNAESFSNNANTANINANIANTNAWLAFQSTNTSSSFISTNVAYAATNASYAAANASYAAANASSAQTANTNAWASRTTITDDTTTNAVRYILITTQTSGNLTIANTSSSKLYYNCSTGSAYATTFNNTSDESLKKDVIDIEDALETVSQIRGVKFTWKDTNQKSLGVIAQEVETVLPEVVFEENGIKSVSYGSFVGLLIEAIKELKNRIEVLENK